MTFSQPISRVSLAAGRIGIASLFVLGGLNKILNYSSTMEQMHNVGIAYAEAVLPVVILLELVGGLLVTCGNRWTLPAAYLLAGFTLSTNLAFHDFWNMEGQIAALERSMFFKNVSIAGALIFVAGTIALRVKIEG